MPSVEGVDDDSPAKGYGVHGKSDTATGVRGESDIGGYGVFGKSKAVVDEDTGIARGEGVYGECDGNIGVHGKSETATGVFGESYGMSGEGEPFGVHGKSDNATGVRGESTTGIGVSANSDTGSGVYSFSNSSTGVFGGSIEGEGVFGSSTYKDGVSGTTRSSSDFPDDPYEMHHAGVRGHSENDIGVRGQSEHHIGVYGYSKDHIAVYGYNAGYTYPNPTGVLGVSKLRGTGVWGESFNGTGVYGTSYKYGVYGNGYSSYGSEGHGVHGWTQGGVGVYGEASHEVGLGGPKPDGDVDAFQDTGVYGTSYTYGVYGYGFGAYGSKGHGVHGYTEGGVGVYGEASQRYGGWAARFNGRVDIQGHLTKSGGSFKIDHPLDPANKYLCHSFVESPDMKNVYDGLVVLDNKGEAEIQLPDWFGALNKDFRYQLTAIGAPGPNLYIAEEIISDTTTKYGSDDDNNGNRFKIAGGTSGMKVSWQVTGICKDPWANAHRIQVEEDKPDRERGYYMYPELYGQPEENGISRLLFPEEEKQELLINENKLT